MSDDEIPEELRRLIEEQINRYNRQGQGDFDGLSPEQMRLLIYDPFNEGCVLQFNWLDVDDLKDVPLFRQAYYLASLINELKVVKLTAKGWLPLKIVADVRSRRLLIDDKEHMIELNKVYREEECYGIYVSRMLLRLSGITKRSVKKLELSAKGKKLLGDKRAFFKVIFESFAEKFNWAYRDGYDSAVAGQFGWAYSMLLVAKYGDVARTDEFYSKKYYDAFPVLRNDFRFDYPSGENHCYSIRMFSYFLEYLGLVDVTYPKDFRSQPTVVKTRLFDKFVKVRGQWL